jgi:hypothetical protein
VDKKWQADDQTEAFVKGMIRSIEDELEDVSSPLAGEYRPKRLDAQRQTRTGGDIRVWGNLSMMDSRDSTGLDSP